MFFRARFARESGWSILDTALMIAATLGAGAGLTLIACTPKAFLAEITHMFRSTFETILVCAILALICLSCTMLNEICRVLEVLHDVSMNPNRALLKAPVPRETGENRKILDSHVEKKSKTHSAHRSLYLRLLYMLHFV